MSKDIYLKPRMMLLITLILIVLTLPFFQGNSLITEDSDYKPNLFSLKSRSLSSFSPMAISSRSGQINLLFLHETQDYDAIGREYYHTNELETGKWSLPQKVLGSGVRTIFNVTITKKGFIVYYYNEGIEKRGPCYREYDEQSKMWSDETQIFGKSQIIDFLGLTGVESKQFSFWIYSFHIITNESYLIVWSFEFHHRSDFIHEYEGLYIASIVSGDGTIDSHPLLGLNHSPLTQLSFIPIGNRSFLYSPRFNERIVYSNGNWPEWQTTGFNESFSSCWDKSIITDRYLLCHGAYRRGKPAWGLVDLTVENLSIEIVSLPKWNITDYRLALDSKEDFMIKTAILSNHSIELWKYDYLIQNWTQLAFLLHEYKSPYSQDRFGIELLRDEDNWRVFWDESLNESTWLHEVFTVSYNIVSEKWSPIIQVTETIQITDDYGSGIPGFTLFQVLIGMICTLLLIKWKSKRKYHLKWVGKESFLKY